MAIFVPGKRDRHNRPLRASNRSAIFMLSLTAMVDMFTVLAVFLLYNYRVDAGVIDISDEVKLPKASSVKELKPAHVVVIGPEGLILDKNKIASFAQVKEQQEWVIAPLLNRLTESFKEAELKRRQGLAPVKAVVDEAKSKDMTQEENDMRRVTVQADKKIDFLTVKKVMFTLTEAGASEINFAVIKDDAPTEVQ